MLVFAISALFQPVATVWFRLCSAAHLIAFVVACPVVAWAGATFMIAASFDHDVAPPTGELVPAARSIVCVYFHFIPNPLPSSLDTIH